jgi:protein-L-isoaspartate(D-aspartate) O-methyltransferase
LLPRAKIWSNRKSANGITDPGLSRRCELAREDFRTGGKRDIAYMDEDIPLTTPSGGGPERVLIEPMAFARLVQLARIGAGDNILHVGRR